MHPHETAAKDSTNRSGILSDGTTPHKSSAAAWMSCDKWEKAADWKFSAARAAREPNSH
jgi:hypothetical protein